VGDTGEVPAGAASGRVDGAVCLLGDLAMLVGVCCATWLLLGALMGPGWSHRVARTAARASRSWAEEVGLVDPDGVVIRDPTPLATPDP
jgi:hypothetical protein